MAFSFLELAAELRNRIYHYCGVNDGKHVRIRKADGASGVFHGLTNVSRQVRSEYRPIYRSAIRVTLSCDDITEFVNTFLVTDKDRVSPFRDIFISERNWTRKSQDLLPLVKAKVAHPAFRSKFKADIHRGNNTSQTYRSVTQIEYLEGCIAALNELLNNDNAAWKSKIANGEITALRLYFWAVPFHGLHVSFARGHTPQGIIQFRTGEDNEKLAEFFDSMWESWGFTPGFRKYLVVKHCEFSSDIGHY